MGNWDFRKKLPIRYYLLLITNLSNYLAELVIWFNLPKNVVVFGLNAEVLEG
ncbi:hypothetical protein NIES2111_37390 [Nostoc sp. NIES-2111]|nr:hypothetical protein NIES2111_37390 [Nostoc sp. NIES-2111]